MASQHPEPIAIVGSGCRFPGNVNSPIDLWELLQEPRDVSKAISQTDRFDPTGYYHPDGNHHATTNVERAYFLENNLMKEFDASFFNMSPAEADSTDPQQRLLLETVYEALEAGGHTIEALRGSDTAVFVGCMGVDWNDLLLRDPNTLPTYFATGTNRAIISNRVSYFFDWHGPSMTIDTACSSSLVAVHQGVQVLRSGESSVAVACGSNVILGPDAFVFESKMKMLSPTGRSRMWDANADGYARGDGIAAVILKRLSDAIADGDHIECLVRETGANQDGHSTGITVPSTAAQTALIRKTYAKAGLDPENNPCDRPQFFEAHGTGTKAGDPKEAAAIANCFGGNCTSPLYVGSVKTVIGHTEGAAGLAGVLKASSMIQHGIIAPNMLFSRLNPEIEQYYQGLDVPKTPISWPKLHEGVPRRVSVNSFGFGGSNAHAILEEYRAAPSDNLTKDNDQEESSFVPFVFSATSEESLGLLLQRYSDALRMNEDISISDLAWTLQYRKSQLPIKTSVSALNIEQLISKIDQKLAHVKDNAGQSIGTRSKPTTTSPRILGVFTGQGAQWAAMGAELLRSSDYVRKRAQELEKSLATLPPSDRPSWGLQEEILAEADQSRIHEAELSQPLCTVIQILLVDLLQLAGITFQAVVGHSSGEIAAAYAASFISAQDAVRIAYYRGLHSARFAGNAENGQKGAMLAVGTSWDDAFELINLRAFRGRLQVAAHNSSASVTLSGDADAIIHAKKVFDEEKKFTRLLKVDTAYHSHHMLACGEPYIQSLQECNIQVEMDSKSTCTWFSSVFGGRAIGLHEAELLKDVYWRDNMTNAVLFAEAIQSAAGNTKEEQPGLIIEVGPHPALRGPATQTLSEVGSAVPAYTGVLRRGNSDLESFSDALGFIWTYFGASCIDFESFSRAMLGRTSKPQLVTGLPSYPWNHGRTHWYESRRSKKIRGRKEPFHEILGVPCPDSTDQDRRWQNLLKLSEIPWLSGHQLQGQTVFPAAGYCAMAFEAARSVADRRSVKLFELEDLSIPKAITFEEDANFAIETLVTLTSIVGTESAITAVFSCYSVPTSGPDIDMELMASGSVKVVLGIPSPTALFSKPLEDYNMTPVEPDKFYSNLLDLGYGYSGGFQAMTAQKRRYNQASALVSTYAYTDADSSVYLIHPTMLDVTFQATMLAFSAPGDDRLWSLHVPTRIGKIRINPELCGSLPISTATTLPTCVVLNDNNDANSICASVDVFGPEDQQTLIQVEDLTMKPFAPATAADDRHLFASTRWNYATPNGAVIVRDVHPSAEEIELAMFCERLSHAYLRSWKLDLTDEDWKNSPWYFRYLQEFMDHTLSAVSRGQHPCVKKEWSGDTLEDVKALISRRGYAETVDIKLISAVCENIPGVVRGQTTILEHMVADEMLDVFYKKGLGFETYNGLLADIAQQITHRYPHARILEIGAGTGGATKTILERIGKSLSSYTYTDISVGFFDKAAELFKAYSDRMGFKVFDVEKPPVSQGFEPHSYDLVIASNVLHATASIKRTLGHARQLLKPGGYLLMLEVTNNGPIRPTTTMGGLPGWWIGEEDGRKGAPTITSREWHSALRKSGFSGVDAITPDIDTSPWPFSIMASQAVDDRINFLRQPLSISSSDSSVSIYLPRVVILGARSLETARISEEVSKLLGRFCGQITILEGLPAEDDANILGFNPMDTSFINLVDIDSPIFKDLTDERMAGLKRVFELGKHVLWITVGAQYDEPYHMASIAFSRVVSHEARHISLDHLDISNLSHDVSKNIAEHLLRHHALEEWEPHKHQFLWSKEPEVYLDRGQLKLPRLMVNAEMNGRLNSTKRTVTKSVSIPKANISIFADSPTSLHVVEEVLPVASKNDNQGLVQIESSTTMALPVTNTDAFLFLGLGKILGNTATKTADTVVTLSAANSSWISPIASVAISETILSRQIDSHFLLTLVASELIAASLLTALPSKSSILVHGSVKHRFLAAALTRRATARSVRVTLSCSSECTNILDSSWIKLDARAPRHIMRRALLTTKASHFLDLNLHTGEDDMSCNIIQALHPTCQRLELSHLCCHESEVSSLSSKTSEKLSTHLEELVSSAMKAAVTSTSPAQYEDLVVHLNEIYDQKYCRRPSNLTLTSVVRWPLEGNIEVEVWPLNARRLFALDKTYLLVGLSGQIGQSLCEWMVRNGAGCVILTSRRPKVDERWLKSFEGGATVKVMPLDITDYQSLEKVVQMIRATCPPIAGIANGAMVLHDSLFSDMPLEQMTEVLRPKIDGTRNLGALFYNDDLDFFILFSSSAGVVGNLGQSNYAAANGYLNSFARQRRKRGLAASSFDIGRVAGLGYAEATGQFVIEQLTRLGLLPISEPEFHTMFAETIRAGYVDPNDLEGEDERAVVTTGIRQIRDDEEIQRPWFDNPRFSHFIAETRGAESGDKSQDDGKSLPVSKQLASATDREAALVVLEDCFAAKLRVILQSTDREIEHEVPLVELGVDSLVAVEVRSWFLKELKVDVPVLKVVGGSSVADLCRLALGKLPEELAANIGKGAEETREDQETHEMSSLLAKTSKVYATSATVTLTKSESKTTSKDAGSSSASPSSVDRKFSSLEDTTEIAPTQLSTRTPSFENFGGLSKPSPTQRFLKSEMISFGQSRFWFLRLLLQDQTTFNVTFYYQIIGSIRVGDLERAVRTVTARHEALRTCFVADSDALASDIAYQKIMQSSPLRLEHKRVSRVEDVEVEYASLKAYVFDIANGDLMRVILLTLSPNAHYMLISYHHIVMDGVSLQVFMSDLEKAYEGKPLALAAPPRQFPDFSRAQRMQFKKGEMNGELEFWQRVFPDEPPVLPLLPMARVGSRLPMKSFDVHQVEFRIEPALAAQIKLAARTQQSTTFHFYLAALKTMIFLFTDIQDLTIGIADANRIDSDVMETIGFFLNLLPLRFRRQLDQCFCDAVVEARNTTYAALGNSRLPFDVLLEQHNVPRSSLHSPVFQCFFDYRQGAQAKHAFGSAQFEVKEAHPGRTAYDITLDVTESATDAVVLFRTQQNLYDLTAANLLLETYIHLVDTLSKQVSLPLNGTPLFGEKQLVNATKIGHGPELASTWPGTLVHRIEHVASRNQDKVALMDGLGRNMTYADMMNRVEAIAEALQKEAGVGTGSKVLVFQHPTVDWPCSMLAIMRIGAMYVPLDLRNPLPRLAVVAASCKPTAVLADDANMGDTAQLLVDIPSVKVVNILHVPPKPSVHIPNYAKAKSSAAILYTSGSTGLPKGIMVTHSGLRNEIEGYTKTWNLGAERVLQQSSFTFNHSSDQIYTGLVNGGMVYIVPWDKRGDPIEITKLVQQHSITYTKATPCEYSLWMQYNAETLRKASNWRFAFAGGESLSSTVVHEFAQLGLPQLRLFNSYGPTEISISSHKTEVAIKSKPDNVLGCIPCGYTLPNYATYILDDKLKPLPAGMPGEVVIGGAGVSLGYLNDKELTERHFVSNPYTSVEFAKQGWDRMYRTGDIGHLQTDGALVFHRRVAGDTQIKIRGLRIELSDIESNILAAADGALREVVVTPRQGDAGSEFLVAHAVFAPQDGRNIPDKEAFLQRLRGQLSLPQYMVPVSIIPLDKLPLTNHSKVDRKAIGERLLPQRVVDGGPTKDESNWTETMVKLEKVWRSVLKTNTVNVVLSPSTSFFLIGGSSLLVIRLQSRIRQVFNVTVPLVELIGANKLGEMAQKVDESVGINTLDWEKETALPHIPTSLLSAGGTETGPKTGKKTILVTGGTGYLAKYILPQLATRTDVGTIYLVAVRDKPSEGSPRKLPIESTSTVQVVSHPGNLSLPFLGLPEEEFAALSHDVDLILHMGAVRSFWDPYHVLRQTNVHSTRELVKLAASRKVPIHYISSVGVFPAESDEHGDISLPPPSSAAAHIPPRDGSSGYVSSRWASERTLERAAEQLGISTTVHRFVPSSKGVAASPADIREEFVRYVDLSQAMPDFEGWSGRVDVIDAGEAARWVCEAIDSDLRTAVSQVNGEGLMKFRHCESPVAVDVAELRAHLEQTRGNKGYLWISGLKWIGRIKALGFGYFFAGQEVALQGRESDVRFESRR